jgi:hypothetical protein
VLWRNDDEDGNYLSIGCYRDADTGQLIRFISLEDSETAIQFRFTSDNQIASIQTQLLSLMAETKVTLDKENVKNG